MRLEVFNQPDQKNYIDENILSLDIRQRVYRGAQGAAFFLLVTAISLPIPVVHLVLVPVSLFLSFFTAFWRYRQRFLIQIDDLKCPQCGHIQAINTGIKDWPLRAHCQNCRNQFLVRPAENQPAEG